MLFANLKLWLFPDTEDASEGETGKKDREFTGIKEQYVLFIIYYYFLKIWGPFFLIVANRLF